MFWSEGGPLLVSIKLLKVVFCDVEPIFLYFMIKGDFVKAVVRHATASDTRLSGVGSKQSSNFEKLVISDWSEKGRDDEEHKLRATVEYPSGNTTNYGLWRIEERARETEKIAM